MGISGSISRISDYYKRHTLWATLRRAGLAAQRALFSNRMVVFYCDLAKQTPAPVSMPGSLNVQRLRSYAELGAQDLQEIIRFWNPQQAHRNIRERFARGASLWLLKSEDKLAGYGWTLQGSSIEPYFFPLTPNDVHLFDFHVFPPYRGRGMNPHLVAYILRTLGSDRTGRAFIEAAEWNHAQLSSLRKTAFLPLGFVGSFSIFGRKYVCWVKDNAQETAQDEVRRRSESLKTAKLHE